MCLFLEDRTTPVIINTAPMKWKAINFSLNIVAKNDVYKKGTFKIPDIDTRID